jgi:phage gp16-like protein
MSAVARRQVSSDRRAMLAKVHLAAKELGLDEDTRRDVLERVTGQRSSADCTDAQLDELLREFRRMGWQPRPGRAAAPVARTAAPKVASSPIAMKARAMWKSLDNLGAVRNGSEQALEAFAKRQLHVDRLQWADQSQGFRLIEALKAMAEREGWSQEMAGVTRGQEVISLKRRLVQRQAEILGREPFRLAGMTERELDALARENRAAVRAARGLE